MVELRVDRGLVLGGYQIDYPTFRVAHPRPSPIARTQRGAPGENSTHLSR